MRNPAHKLKHPHATPCEPPRVAAVSPNLCNTSPFSASNLLSNLKSVPRPLAPHFAPETRPPNPQSEPPRAAAVSPPFCILLRHPQPQTPPQSVPSR
jgi:hypothetical protein